ncbi:MAG TPA: hypothetical protein VIG64_00725, partial [Actinomycetota bacterium]
VGGSPGRTLDGKLQRLETAIRMPVRFLAAADLAQLREQVLSPLPLDDLVSELVDGPRVVPSGFADRLVLIRRKQEEAHKHLVRTMLRPLDEYSED